MFYKTKVMIATLKGLKEQRNIDPVKLKADIRPTFLF